MTNLDFYKLNTQIDGRDIVLSNGYIPLHNGKDDIIVTGLFVETDRKYAFDSHFPKKEMFEGLTVYPLLAVGFDTDHDESIPKSKAKYIYDIDLDLLLNEGIARSFLIRQFFAGKKFIGRDSPDYVTNMTTHEIGHALVGYLEAGDNKLSGTVSMSGHSSITAYHDVTTIEGLEIKIREALGGLAAEMIMGDFHRNSRSDLACAAHAIIRSIINYSMFSVKHGTIVFDLPDGRPSVTLGTVVQSMIMYYLPQTRELLAGKECLIRHLADHLIDEGEISAERLEEIIGDYTGGDNEQSFCYSGCTS